MAPTIFSMTLASLGVQKISKHPRQHPWDPGSLHTEQVPSPCQKKCLAIKPDPNMCYFPSSAQTPAQYTPSAGLRIPTFSFLLALQEPAVNHLQARGPSSIGCPQPPLLCRPCPFLSHRSVLCSQLGADVTDPHNCVSIIFSFTPFKSK